MGVRDINSSAEFFALLQNKNFKFTVVDFTAKWCRPCQQIKPYFAELSSLFPQFQFLKVDVDEHSELAYWANVRAMPTFTIYKDGFKVNESLGANLNKIVEMVKVLN